MNELLQVNCLDLFIIFAIGIAVAGVKGDFKASLGELCGSERLWIMDFGIGIQRRD